MAEKDENVVEETTQQEQPKIDEKVEKIKVKKKPSMKKINDDSDGVTKVDLSKPLKTEEVKEEKIEEEKVEEEKVEQETIEEVVSKKEEEVEEEKIETPVLEELTGEEEVKEDIEEVAEQAEQAIKENMETGKPLPENIQKLVDFMEDTGGNLEDYIRLNQDYSKLDNITLLKEYYKQTKPHLDNEEIEFLMDDNFSFDEDEDDEKEVRRKKLALKEQVASAKSHLDGQKSKYYEDIKMGSKLTGEQQKAIDFFNRYNKESKEQQDIADQQHRAFLNKKDQLFNKNFKGFEYNVGEKRFRFNVKDAGSVKEKQVDINNFVKKFLNKNNEIEDAKGYHKSLYTAMNPDAVAKHFYEQGKVDALKNSVAKSKNINMDPRQQHSGVVEAGGIKVRVLGENSNDFKFKIKNKNK